MSSIRDLFEWQQAKENKDDYYCPSLDTRIIGTKFIVDKLYEDDIQEYAASGIKAGDAVTLVNDIAGEYYAHVGTFIVDKNCIHRIGLFWRQVSPYIKE